MTRMAVDKNRRKKTGWTGVTTGGTVNSCQGKDAGVSLAIATHSSSTWR